MITWELQQALLLNSRSVASLPDIICAKPLYASMASHASHPSILEELEALKDDEWVDASDAAMISRGGVS